MLICVVMLLFVLFACALEYFCCNYFELSLTLVDYSRIAHDMFSSALRSLLRFFLCFVDGFSDWLSVDFKPPGIPMGIAMWISLLMSFGRCGDVPFCTALMEINTLECAHREFMRLLRRCYRISLHYLLPSILACAKRNGLRLGYCGDMPFCAALMQRN